MITKQTKEVAEVVLLAIVRAKEAKLEEIKGYVYNSDMAIQRTLATAEIRSLRQTLNELATR